VCVCVCVFQQDSGYVAKVSLQRWCEHKKIVKNLFVCTKEREREEVFAACLSYVLNRVEQVFGKFLLENTIYELMCVCVSVAEASEEIEI
jgi:hypothetical protein